MQSVTWNDRAVAHSWCNTDETIEGEPGNTREGSKQAQRNSAHDKANELKHHLIRKPWFSMVAELRNALQASEEENTQLKDNSLEAFKRRFVTVRG